MGYVPPYGLFLLCPQFITSGLVAEGTLDARAVVRSRSRLFGYHCEAEQEAPPTAGRFSSGCRPVRRTHDSRRVARTCQFGRAANQQQGDESRQYENAGWGLLVIGHTDKAARRLCRASLLRNVG